MKYGEKYMKYGEKYMKYGEKYVIYSKTSDFEAWFDTLWLPYNTKHKLYCRSQELKAKKNVRFRFPDPTSDFAPTLNILLWILMKL